MLVLAGLLVVGLAAVGLVGVGLVFSRCDASASSSSSPVCLGSDGIPNQLDGQRVYRVGEQAEWQNLSGGFLLGGYAYDEVESCPTILPQPSAEADLLGQCGGIELAPAANENQAFGLPMLAPVGTDLLDGLYGWAGGPAVVVRAHTHDPEAAACSAAKRAACEAAVVVEAVVWSARPSANATPIPAVTHA
jgi:hypothetical protein